MWKRLPWIFALACLAACTGAGLDPPPDGSTIISREGSTLTVRKGVCGSDGTLSLQVDVSSPDDVPMIQVWTGTAAARSPVDVVTMDHQGHLTAECGAPFDLYWVVIVR